MKGIRTAMGVGGSCPRLLEAAPAGGGPAAAALPPPLLLASAVLNVVVNIPRAADGMVIAETNS